MFTETLAQRDSIAGTPLHPATYNGANNTGFVDMSLFNRVEFIGALGANGTAATLDGYLQESNNTNGTGATPVTGSNLTQIASANSRFTMECRSDQLTKRYVRAVLTISVASSACCFPIATHHRYGPQGSDVDTTNSQRVVV